ncbi:deoxyribose-phosphate aldolase [Silvanigrella aquatica]|uniref:Deoxyribose-phosphate aldolase n=1 Tax=Silvanigrella aquatica TaxID=1915309 RepID=A0A1L4D4L5_9BACT|nr:deoxyribose-phosphate aldolase [Silvanigrella aquatica]
MDSTLLKQSSTDSQIIELCQEALQNSFRAVCVPPNYVGLAKKILQNSNVKICSVAAFPLGYCSLDTKIFEIENLIQNGADEIDFVQNVTLVKNSNFSELEKEYKTIVSVAKDKLIKVILETALLSDEEIYKCSFLAALSGVHVVKTSTGFSTRGASLNDIEVIKNALSKYQNETGYYVGIKASGGIRCYQDAVSFVQAGATRLGTSGGLAIINEKENLSSY